MSIRWSEEEAREFGFVRDGQGNWRRSNHVPSRETALPTRSADAVPVVQQAKERPAPRKDQHRKGSEESSEVGNREKFRIEVTSHTRFKCDNDNMCPKWFIDELVKAGVLPGDSCDYVAAYETRVVRVKRKEDEKTVIEVWR